MPSGHKKTQNEGYLKIFLKTGILMIVVGFVILMWATMFEQTKCGGGKVLGGQNTLFLITRSRHARGLGIAYLACRLILLVILARAWYYVIDTRQLMRIYLTGFGVGAGD